MKETRHTMKTAIGAIVLSLLAAAVLQAVPAEAQKKIEDKDITVAIDTELLLDDAVKSHLIDVKTKNGIVTLSGTVDNALGEERAVRIARSTKGVRSVVELIEVAPMERSDREIREDVVLALAVDPAADSYEIDVEVDDSTITLTGTVESWQEMRLAETVTKGVRGVKSVDNNIRISYREERSDYEIEKDVKRRLETDVLVDDQMITVSVDDGEVTLAGKVGSAEEKHRAWVDAWVTGVDSVDNEELEIEWWARDKMKRKQKSPTLTDAEIEEAVEDALFWDPRVMSFNPEVDVSMGSVTLTGEVGDLMAKRAAEQTALNTTGVWRVVNLLKVRPQNMPSDAVVIKNVRKAIERDPYVSDSDITATVLNGIVYVYGNVDTDYQKWRAEEVIAGVGGVIAVDNSITVIQDYDWVDDLETKADIEDQLFWSPFVDANQVDVTVVDGVATLTGEVETWFERRMAAENAREGGARSVRNKIEVQT